MDEFEESSISDFSGRDGSDSESTQSTPEEERIRRLFATCDSDGDGFITSDDILHVCHTLNLEFSANEIMYQLGAGESGRISYDDFVRRRRELVEDMKAQILSRSSTEDDFWPLQLRNYESREFTLAYNKPERLASFRGSEALGGNFGVDGDEGAKRRWMSSGSGRGSDSVSNSLEAASSSAKHESSSWEFDSGLTHDLNDSEQMSLHRLIESNGVPVPPDAIEVLELANNLHQSALSTAKQEAFEINSRLQLVLQERDLLEKQVASVKREESRLTKELERKRHRDCQKYEDRITELSSIVAELSEKLETHQLQEGNVFREEDEYSRCSESEDSLRSCRLGRDAANELVESKNRLKAVSFENRSLKSELRRRDEEIDGLTKLIEASKVSREKFLIKNDNDSDADSGLANCLKIIGNSDDKGQIIECVCIELERLKYKWLHVRSQLDLANIHLEESQANSEKLTVLLGKFESNNTALHLTTSYLDHAKKGYEIVNRLLETEMGLLLASCRAAGLGKLLGGSDEEEQSEILAVLERAKEKRSHAEQMATEFMDSIEFFQRRDDSAGFQKEDESRIYHFIMDCQKNIDSIKNSLVEIEGLHDDNKLRDVPETELSALTNQKQDLENVVLMQEMMSLKEINAELKSQIFMFEKEKTTTDLKASATRILEKSYLEEIDRLCNEVEEMRGTSSAKTSAAREEIETKLKEHIAELMETIKELAKNYDHHSNEYSNMLDALKKDNGDLRLKLERLRRKQEMRSRRSKTTTDHTKQDYSTPNDLQKLTKETII